MVKRERASVLEAEQRGGSVPKVKRAQGLIRKTRQEQASVTKVEQSQGSVIETKQTPGTVPEAISSAMLNMGVAMDEQGMIHQALGYYLQLIERYPNSQEAPVATTMVLTIAEDLRKKGQYHMAMTVFDRLEAVHQGH